MVKIILWISTLLLTQATSAFTLGSTGTERAWPGKTLTFYLDSSNCPASVANALTSAMEIWSNVPTSAMKLKYGGSVSTTPSALINGTAGSVPVIVCDPNFSTNSPSANPNYVGGYGFFNGSGNTITYGGIVLNVQSGAGANISSYSETQLNILLAHEMGHVLGFGHSDFQPALMYYNISGKNSLNLAQDDMDAMTYLYPRDELEDGLYGCGHVHNQQLPPSTKIIALLCLFMPLLILLGKRYAPKDASFRK